MSQTIYRKYRPQKFSEVIGQQHIVRTLTNAIRTDRVGHAYLLTGPRGTGKTTLARIFAKTLNCTGRVADNPEPCLACDSCQAIGNGQSLDIIEIDAASNTGVDNIRELKETIKLPPTQSKFKVYIIDEAHMLSQGAFNALLKTLEEPPAHVIFILATTELHKVPETILSRCQRFDFSRMSLPLIVEKLSLVAQGEGITVDKDALEMIALSAEGGMRDAESLFSQIIALEDKKITAKEVEEILGTTDRKAISDMAHHIVARDLPAALSLVRRIIEDGYDLEVFIKQLLHHLRHIMLGAIDPSFITTLADELTSDQIENIKSETALVSLPSLITAINEIAKSRIEMKSAYIPELPFEIALSRSLDMKNAASPAGIQEPKKNDTLETRNTPEKETTPRPQPETSPEKPASIKKTEPITSSDSEVAPEEPAIESPAIVTIDNGMDVSLDDIKRAWPRFLQEVKPHNHSLHAFLANAYAIKIEGKVITIAVKFPFHRDKCNEMENRLTMETVLGTILEAKVKIQAVTEAEAGIKAQATGYEEQTANIPEKPSETSSLLTDALAILGGKVVE